MEARNRVYYTANAGWSARPTSFDKNGEPVDVHNEQYKRDEPLARTPDMWGLKHVKTGKLTRLKPSRAVARASRKPTECVVAIWL